MKKTTLLHAELSRTIAALGHGDAIVIADAGLPVPPGCLCIDLAVTRGVPTFEQVLHAVLSEMAVERAEHADELMAGDAERADLLARTLMPARIDTLPHAELKRRSAVARAIVRTGEFTPYMNVILYSGVVF